MFQKRRMCSKSFLVRGGWFYTADIHNALDSARTLVFTDQAEGPADDVHKEPGMSAAEDFRFGGEPAQGTPFML